MTKLNFEDFKQARFFFIAKYEFTVGIAQIKIVDLNNFQRNVTPCAI